jgi:hypothetical protein
VRKFNLLVVLSLVLTWFASVGNAATFKLTDGRTISGEILESGSNDALAYVKTGPDVTIDYEKVPWANFSQEDLKELLQKFASNKKLAEAIEPLIEISQEEKAKMTEVKLQPVPEVVKAMQDERQSPKSGVLGSLAKSGLGIFMLVLIYAANVYAGYEIAIFRAQAPALVAGLAAIPIVGFISNIAFLAMPTRVETKSAEDEAFEAQTAAPAAIAIPGTAEAEQAAVQEAQAAAAAGPKVESFKRGQFTFNKRFIETKFAAFFNTVRRDEDRGKVLTFKSTQGEFVALRIVRVGATDVCIQADRGAGASVEMTLQFPEIQEITITHHA